MPPKRISARPLGPVGRPPATSSSRKTLHTQQLMLFSSPVSVVPEKRSVSTNKRTAYPHASRTPQNGQTRKASQRGLALSATATQLSPASTHVEYEPLPEDYRAVSRSLSNGVSSSKVIAPCAVLTTSDNGKRIPIPLPVQPTLTGNGLSLSIAETPATSHPLASGTGSRVVRLLRDARATVRDPIRPETPLETFTEISSSFTSGAANERSLRHLSGTSSLHGPSGRLRTRSQRRLPAGYRLAPITSTAAQSASSAGAALEVAAAGSAASSATPSATPSVHLAMPGGTDFSSTLSCSSPPLPAQKLRFPGRGILEKDGDDVQGELPSSSTHIHDFDAIKFVRLYIPMLHAGDQRIPQAVDLLLQLKQWLVTSLHTTGKLPIFDEEEVMIGLQATLVRFCTSWPDGATLRHALNRISSRSSAATDSDEVGGFRVSQSLAGPNAPLLYAQGALIAVSIILEGFPIASLVANSILFEAIAHTLHIVADAGLAGWIARDDSFLKGIVELLQLLASPEVCAQLQAQRCVKWILDTIALCCEDAADGATTAAEDALLEAGDLMMSRSRQQLSCSGSASNSGLLASGCVEMDTTHSSEVRDNELKGQVCTMPRRPPPPCVTSASLQRQSFSHVSPSSDCSASVADVMAAGPSVSLLSHKGCGVAASQLLHSSPSNSFKEGRDFCRCLVSLGFLPILQRLSDYALARRVPASLDLNDHQSGDSPPSLLPIIGHLYRFLVQCHPKELHLLGVVDTLTNMLNTCAEDPATVEAAARTLVKLTYVDECLVSMQASTAVMAAATHALQIQISNVPANASQGSPTGLLVSRLCGLMARIAEHSTVHQEYLVSPLMTQLLEALATRYLTVCSPAEVGQDSIEASPSLPPAPVLQAVVWVLGIAAISPQCPLRLVQSVTPLLVHLLGVLRRMPEVKQTAVYVLMCLSNLSYFFGAFESTDGSEIDGANKSDWLVSLYSSLGFLLAHYLFEDNAEATVEATRILGNISYTNAGRDWMETNHCDEVIALFLGHEDLRIVYNCCGVLLNLTAAFPCRIVQEPGLLQMVLSYTSRYTDHNRIKAVAALEETRLRERHTGEDVVELVAEVRSHTAQIADVVEKLLLNVQGVLAVSILPNADSEIQG